MTRAYIPKKYTLGPAARETYSVVQDEHFPSHVSLIFAGLRSP